MTTANAKAKADSSELISSAEVIPASSRFDNRDTSGNSVGSEADRWDDAIDTLLGWCQDPDVDSERLDSAIDFAVDQGSVGADPPSSITATDDGDITFEWRTKRTVVLVTIFGAGIADYVRLRDFKVIEEYQLRRDPRTRKLQLQDQ